MTGTLPRWGTPIVVLALLTALAAWAVLAEPKSFDQSGAGADNAFTRVPRAVATAMAGSAATPVPASSATTPALAPPAPVSSTRVAAPISSVATVTPAPSVAARAVVAAVPSDGRRHLISIGSRRLAIWCLGQGSPTVILEHGIGYTVDSASWRTVQQGLAGSTRVCRYDRAFVGDSDDASAGRSMPNLATDLRLLLRAAGIPGPYILVGHSFGGLTVRYFALRYPADVAGIVLVDGSPPGAITNLDLGSERLNRTRVLAQLATLKRLGNIPLVVVTRGIGVTPAWAQAQRAMVSLSTRSRQVVAATSDHWIQLRQPLLVTRQVQTVINTLRRYSAAGG